MHIKREIIPWSALKASWAANKLKNFPKCGARFTNEKGTSLVMIRPDEWYNSELQQQKIKAACSYPGVSKVLITRIPEGIAGTMGL